MKKFSFAKIASLVFVCAMLLCALAVTALAADEPTVEIVSYNVYYGEKYQLMFAVNAPDGADVSVTDAEGNVLSHGAFAEDPNPVIDGVECKAYIVKDGVAAQAIEEVVTFTVEYNGTVVSKSYSVLQYITERTNGTSDNQATGAELEMFNALLAYAEKSDIFLDGTAADKSISSYKYVTVVKGTLDGNNTAGMFLPDANPFENIVTTEVYDNTAFNVEWDVSVDGAEAERYDNDAIKTLTVTGNMTVTAVLVESECSHDWSVATCETLSTCSKCGETTGVLAEHTWVDATCKAPKTCSVCGETEGDLADHTWSTWSVTTDPTCTKAGEQSRNCPVCEKTETQPVAATGAHADANADNKCDGCGGMIVVSYTLVTDVKDLQAGDKIIIVATDSNVALSTTQNTNNRGQTAVTKNGNSVSITTAVQIITLETGTANGTFAFNTGSGYLYASSGSSNQLKTTKTLDANGSWLITITDGVASIVAQGSNARNVMQYNPANSLFACYASASQKAISIYTETVTVTCAHETLVDVTVVEPTCTEKGSESGTCVECGETVDKEIPAKGHTEVTVPGYAATCGEDGLTDGKVCSVCDEVLIAQEPISATGEHNDGDSDGLCDVCELDLNTDEAKADSVLAGIEAPADVTKAGDVELDETNDTGYEATIEWSIVGGTNTGSTISNNVLTVVLGNSGTTIDLKVSVTVGEATVTADYTINVAPAVVEPVTETMSIFANKGTLNNKTITWSGSAVTVVGAQASSTTAIRTSDSDHYRIYAKSTFTISCTGMTKIVITATSDDYATVLAGSLTTKGATATVSGSTVTVTVTDGTLNEIMFTATAQTRVSQIVVTYNP